MWGNFSSSRARTQDGRPLVNGTVNKNNGDTVPVLELYGGSQEPLRPVSRELCEVSALLPFSQDRGRYMMNVGFDT
jgi:hypothetical protein